MKKAFSVKNVVLSAMFLALGLVLPFLTGQIPQVGSMLLPMHIPALLCGFICGWPCGLIVGFAAPLLRSVLFGMPPMLVAIPMAFELATYGAVSGALYNALKKTPANTYISLIGAMIAGRVVWSVVRCVMMFSGSSAFGWAMFISGAFTSAIPGIVVQLVLIPIILLALKRAKLIDKEA